MATNKQKRTLSNDNVLFFILLPCCHNYTKHKICLTVQIVGIWFEKTYKLYFFSVFSDLAFVATFLAGVFLVVHFFVAVFFAGISTALSSTSLM